MIIPQGKIVKIKTLRDVKGNIASKSPFPALSQTDLVLEEPLTISLTSSFSSIVESGGGTGGKIATEFVSKFTKQIFNFEIGKSFKQLGFQTWDKTDPVRVSITAGLYMKTDARIDVFEPMKELIKIPLPEDLYQSGEGVGLKSPGPTVLEAAGWDKSTPQTSKQLLLVQIGNIYLFPCLITKAEPTINPEVDQFGYNISAKIRFDVQTLYTATTNLIDKWGVGYTALT